MPTNKSDLLTNLKHNNNQPPDKGEEDDDHDIMIIDRTSNSNNSNSIKNNDYKFLTTFFHMKNNKSNTTNKSQLQQTIALSTNQSILSSSVSSASSAASAASSSSSSSSLSQNFNDNNNNNDDGIKLQNNNENESDNANTSTNNNKIINNTDSIKCELNITNKKDQHNQDTLGKTENNNFVLPRAMLKHQSMISMDSVPSTTDASVNSSMCKSFTNNITSNECNSNNNIISSYNNRINYSRYSNCNSNIYKSNNNNCNTTEMNEDQHQQQQQQQKYQQHEYHHHHNHHNQKQQLNTINNVVVVNNSDLDQYCGKSEHHHRDNGSGHTTILNSHYSTEKSGSSGYYSSNLCSTSSVEEHIYSEPVIVDATSNNNDNSNIKINNINNNNNNSKNNHNTSMIEKIRTPQVCPSSSSLSSKFLKSGRVKPEDDDEDEDDDDDDDDDDGRESCYSNIEENDAVKINKNLRILETSIETLSRHLNNYSRPIILDDKMKSQSEVSIYDYHRPDKYNHLPTIMEGNDNQSIMTKTQNSWSEELDDSLIDIDLDSFLVNKDNKKINHNNQNGTNYFNQKNHRKLKDYRRRIDLLEGHENLAFNDMSNSDLENNYKCSKYVNSCPENAYKIDSIFNDDDEIISDECHCSNGNSSDSKLNYDKRTHFQNTKEMLDNINAMLKNLSETTCKYKNRNKLIKDLEHNINILKDEFDIYVKLMNRNNELEMKQFCSGLLNNQKLVKITNAFERRKSFINSGNNISGGGGSSNDININYDHNLQSNILRSSISSSTNAQLYENHQFDDIENSIRCSNSDPNFKLKRKPLSEIFPLTKNECYKDYYKSNSDISSVSIENSDYEIPNDNNRVHNTINNNHDSNLNIIDNSHGNYLQIKTNLSLQNTRRNRQQRFQNDEERDSILEWHRDKPSFWELYYGTNRLNQSLYGKKGQLVKAPTSPLSYPSSRPESDFTLDVPKAEQLRLKLECEKKFRQRCRIITTFFSFIFFLLTVMIVSLILTRGKRMFGSMI